MNILTKYTRKSCCQAQVESPSTGRRFQNHNRCPIAIVKAASLAIEAIFERITLPIDLVDTAISRARQKIASLYLDRRFHRAQELPQGKRAFYVLPWIAYDH
jgi:hypothetical protein